VAPTAPATLSAAMTSSNTISLTWGASTAGPSCPVNYDVFRSATSGFTPAAGNQIASAQPGTTYADTGLIAATTYYYVVEAVDPIGASPASNQTSATTPAAGAPAPDFTLAVAPQTLTLTAGTSGTTAVTVAPQNGFASTSAAVKFTCSGLPNGATCAFSPATVTATGDIVSTLTVHTSTVSAAVATRTGLLFSGSSLAVGLCFVRRRRRRSLPWMLILPVTLIGLTLLTACSGSSPGIHPAAVGTPITSTVTVTATSGALMHSAPFSLTVGT
jgi:hypothetical protein